MKINKYQSAILLGIFVVIAVAFLDIRTANSGLLGSIDNYTNGNFNCDCWWNLFKTIVLVLFAIVPLTYYFLVHKDKSEAIAIFLSSYIAWMGGLADLFYFWLQGQSIPETLPWLVNHPVFSKVSEIFLHTKEVLPMTLYISIALGFGLIFTITKLMEKIN